MSSCPDTSILAKLEAGELPDDQADPLFPHVESCSRCTAKLTELRARNMDGRVLRAALGEQGSRELSAGARVAEPSTPVGAGQWSIPDYERVQLCGEGAFGSVWAVRNRVGVYRALKIIDLERLRRANVRCRESTALETYCRHVHRHANLIEVFHVGMQVDLLYYTMELADDDLTRKPVRDHFPQNYHPLTLRRLMQRRPVSPNAAMEIVLQLLRGLSRLHELELAHRDIKPANIVMVHKRPKLADIGMITTSVKSPSQVGTPDYMPPDEVMDTTADVYAMGRILAQLLAGVTSGEEPPPYARAVDAGTQWDLARVNKIIAQACADRAADRFDRADQMLEALESCRELAYDSLFADLDTLPAPPPAKPRRVYVPIVVAAIQTVPWIVGLLLAIKLVDKLF
ncbi:MAG: protein kinase [Phycisphaerae bacterium]